MNQDDTKPFAQDPAATGSGGDDSTQQTPPVTQPVAPAEPPTPTPASTPPPAVEPAAEPMSAPAPTEPAPAPNTPPPVEPSPQGMPQSGYGGAPQQQYAPQGYGPPGGYQPTGGYPPAGAVPPGGMPQGGYGGQQGQYGQDPQAGQMQQEDTTPANFQLGTKLPPQLKAKIPAHELNFDEAYFLRLLAGSISLSKDEKKKIIESVPKLKQTQIDELMRIFEEEKQKFAALSKKHVPQLEKLAQQHYEEWIDLEAEYELTEKKQEEQGKADEIRKNLGL